MYRGGEVRRALVIALGAVAAALLVAACGSSNSSSGGGGGGKGGSIALLLPESKTARYESQDRPHFEQTVRKLCPSCTIIYSNADQDAAKQQQQAEAAITKGAKVLVLDPVDAVSAASIVQRAKQSKIPVVSYDRLIEKAPIDYYVSFDNERVGKLQGQSLAAALKRKGVTNPAVVQINGAPTDSNAALFKKGSTQTLQSAGVKIAKSFDTPDWSNDKAQQEMEQAITALGKTGFQGVYAANDGTAGGAIAAMKSNGVDPKKIPTTGQDAELAGVQRIITGDQYMTVYKAVGVQEAPDAAKIAVAIVQGKPVPSGLVNQHLNNGNKSVPSVILTPVQVTKSNIKSTIIKDGFWTKAQICSGQYASACKAAGL